LKEYREYEGIENKFSCKIRLFVDNVAIQADKRFIFNVRKIEPAVLELAELDPEGQTFRYAYDLNKKLSLDETSNINVGTFVEGFELLLDELESLQYRCVLAGVQKKANGVRPKKPKKKPMVSDLHS
jgi:hypothetical protein